MEEILGNVTETEEELTEFAESTAYTPNEEIVAMYDKWKAGEIEKDDYVEFMWEKTMWIGRDIASRVPRSSNDAVDDIKNECTLEILLRLKDYDPYKAGLSWFYNHCLHKILNNTPGISDPRMTQYYYHENKRLREYLQNLGLTFENTSDVEISKITGTSIKTVKNLRQKINMTTSSLDACPVDIEDKRIEDPETIFIKNEGEEKAEQVYQSLNLYERNIFDWLAAAMPIKWMTVEINKDSQLQEMIHADFGPKKITDALVKKIVANMRVKVKHENKMFYENTREIEDNTQALDADIVDAFHNLKKDTRN